MRETEILRARDELAACGWTVLEDAPFLPHGRPDPEGVLRIATGFGRPSSRDGGREIWTVTPRTTRPGATFSIRAGGAGFHTDAQYHSRPEDVVCLFVVRPAADGGDTMLLTARDVVATLGRDPAGEVALERLAQPVWTWTPPDVFTGKAAAAVPPMPVLPGDGTVRWRRDNLGPLRPPHAHAATVLESGLRRAPATRLRQHPGDVIVIDNHRTLHGRTPFADPERRLLRVRLWADR
ncbi:TauD/TfdA family dioxygenase [Sphaerisporangium aureirubrum]|uniref:TauD/TfdA family dioxygenase n=1 Tax=Sphaerisporangium aureirubrum TaxID=1544736 RepID=A0ABW1NIU6_9ACTN